MRKTSLIYSLIILFVLAASYLSLVILSIPTVRWLTAEDGPFETFGAVSFLVSSLVFLVLYFKHQTGNQFFFMTTKRNVFFLLLCLLFFFAFGEEISWGQRIFGFATPKSLAEMNLQGEFTLHNLKVFHGRDASGQRKSDIALLINMDRLFSLFWFLYCVAIPVWVHFHPRMAEQLRRLNLPLVPIWLGLFFPVNYLLSKSVVLSLRYAEFKNFNHWTVETKESLFAFLFVLVAFYFLQQSKRSASQKARVDT